MLRNYEYASIRERVMTVPWFANCGQQGVEIKLGDVGVVRSWKQAERSYKGRSWKNATLEARNDFTEWLATNHRKLFNETWNEWVDEEKSWFLEYLNPVFARAHNEHGVGIDLDHDVNWNVCGALMEARYDHLNHPHKFFRRYLLPIYETGHMPCGWEGANWPEPGAWETGACPIGRLIVF